MTKYTSDAKLLADYVGEVENVVAVTRFVLHKSSLVAVEKIEELASVIRNIYTSRVVSDYYWFRCSRFF